MTLIDLNSNRFLRHSLLPGTAVTAAKAMIVVGFRFSAAVTSLLVVTSVSKLNSNSVLRHSYM